jgi:hypothetical protein
MLSFAACATARAPAIATSAEPSAPLAIPIAQLERLQKLVPDYLARAQRAEARAKTAATSAIAEEHRACAQLLLEAAQAEADRVELERELLAEELRRDAALRELAQVEYARLSEKLAQRPAEAEPAHTHTPVSQRTAADAYIRRARLSLAAARALGAEPAELAQAERRVREANDREGLARSALEQAERVLDAARRRSRPASPLSGTDEQHIRTGVGAHELSMPAL